MATATAKLKQPVIQPLESVTLTLNPDEVQTLITVLNRIGGSPSNSPRKHTQSISDALHDAFNSMGALIDTSGIKFDDQISRPGTMYFKDF